MAHRLISRKFRAAFLGSVAGLLVLGVGVALPASADQVSDGLWYFTKFNVQQAHDAGYTGAGVTIAVIDNEIYPGLPELGGADVEVQPDSGCKDAQGQPIPASTSSIAAQHGTEVTSLLVGSGIGYSGQRGVEGVAPKSKVLFYSTGEGSATAGDDAITCHLDGRDVVAKSIDAAVKSGATIISISQGNDNSSQLAAAVAGAVRAGVVIVAALSNTVPSTFGEFPAWSNGVVSVQAMDSSGVVQGTDGVPNVDQYTDVVGPGVGILSQGARSTGSWQDQSLATGTSAATPIIAGFLALVKQKYPEATGNQLIQSLIHNTGKADHPLQYDPKHLTGYAVAVLDHLLAVDPAKYPDVNPLIAAGANQSPTAAQIAGKSASKPSQSASSTPAVTAGGPGWILLLIVVGGIVVVLAVILVIVLATRRARRKPHS